MSTPDPMGTVYRERAHLVAHLAALYPSTIGLTDPSEADWAVVTVNTPEGQMCWHISPNDYDLFEHVPRSLDAAWDGHTTEEKYARLDAHTRALAQKESTTMDQQTHLPVNEMVVKTAGTYGRDLLERTLSTFLQSFVGGIVITQPLDGSMWYAAGAGGVGAVLALGKGLIARWRDVTNSASLAKGV
ncbi:hypothetical protein ACFC08_35475 [Streptomyces sp. NPDC056112]|uniref:WDGH domain-containing protein n=1 Tax=Streptomyces sp. NPDC056112 TaxID=3345715 RepID=UPI0035DBE9E6